ASCIPCNDCGQFVNSLQTTTSADDTDCCEIALLNGFTANGVFSLLLHNQLCRFWQFYLEKTHWLDEFTTKKWKTRFKNLYMQNGYKCHYATKNGRQLICEDQQTVLDDAKWIAMKEFKTCFISGWCEQCQPSC
uniref:Uncharacterized protein n=1 Tax=Parascaris univalens TaxID=6257 RepID=A0A915CFW8_PARUN